MIKTGRPKSKRTALGEDDKDETQQVYKNRILVHDIHRVRELSALLEERRRYFDGQLGQVYRNAGVSSPNTALPRLRGMDSPPISATPSDSNVTGRSLMGTDMSQNVEPSDVQSACSGRSYSIFADDECSVVDAFEFTDSRNDGTRMGRRSWNSSTMLAPPAAPGGQTKKKFSKDTIHNEVMRTADLEKKLKARRSSLPLALEASLKRPVIKKKAVAKQVKGAGSSKALNGINKKSSEGNLSVIASTLLTKDTGYTSTDSEDGGDDVAKGDRPRRFKLTYGDGAEKNPFSMTEILQETRKFDLSQDLKASISLGGGEEFQNVNSLGTRAGKKLGSWDTEIMGVAPRLKSLPMRSSTTGSKSVSSNNLAPNLMEYSPRSSLSTLSGSYPKIAFSSLEKMYREEGDKSNNKFQLHPSSLLLKPVPKIDMHLFSEPSNSEPDYSHDFRYLSLLDALVPCFEPAKTWRPIKSNKKNDDNFFNHNSPYRFQQQRDSGLSRMFPC